jgi:O-antigen/teichoic acid export membrane protein
MKERFLKALEDKDFYELFQKGGLSFLIRIGGQIMGFLLSFVIAYYYGAQGLGNYVLAIVVLRIFTLIAKLGIDTFSIRFIAAFAKQGKWKSIQLLRKKTLVLLSVTSIISSVIMYFLSDTISAMIDTRVEYIKLSSFFILPMIFFILHYQSLRGLKKIAEFSFFYRMSQATFSIVSIFIISTFIKSNSVPIYAYLSSLSIVSVLSVITYQFWFSKKAILNSEEIIEDLTIRNILRISVPLMLAQSVQFIMAWTDKLMIGNMMSAESVAVYGVAFRFSMGVSITLMAINSISSPKFAEKFASDDIKGMGKIAMQSAKMIFWTTVPLATILMIFPKFFMGLYGPEFLIGFEVLRWLIIGRIVNALSGSVGNLMQMSGQQKTYMNILLLGAVINVILNYNLIPKYGINGAAFASVASLSFWNLSMVYMVKRKFGFSTIYIPFISK